MILIEDHHEFLDLYKFKECSYGMEIDMILLPVSSERARTHSIEGDESIPYRGISSSNQSRN
jgi:hypothetical protein